MQVTVIGSSDAFNATGRFHSCYWLEADGCLPLMVDFGATALAAVRAAGKDIRDLGGVAITHLHGDHIGGFPYLLINAMYNEPRAHALPVVGPIGGADRIDSFFRAAYPTVSTRERPFPMPIEALAPGDSTTICGFTVRAWAADHQDPPEQPLCLRITAPSGRSVAFSGDTQMCPGLFAAAAGTDMLIAECTALVPPVGRHCTWESWQPRLADVDSERILLTHLNAEMREAAPRLLAQVPAEINVAFADDGQIYDLTPRTQRLD